MSTKIYTGFKVKYNNLYHFSNKLKELQSEYTKIVQLDIIKRFNIVEYLKVSEFRMDEELTKSIQLEFKKTYSSDIVIYSKKKYILGQHFLYRPLETNFRQQSFYIDYHYQDQTDKPDDITFTEWRKRKYDWSFLNVPAEDGFIFNLVPKSKLELYYLFDIAGKM